MTALALAGILLLAACLRVACFRGYLGDDDGGYAELAYRMAAGRFAIGTYEGPPVFPLRIGLFAPAALGFSLAGPREWILIGYPFALSLAGVLLAFGAGCVLFSRRAGVIAAAVQAILPIDVRSASVLMPDLSAAFWAACGILLLYCLLHGRTRVPPRLLGAACGLAFGLSWLCREFVVYSIPFVAICLGRGLARASRLRAPLLILVASTLAVPTIESWIYWRHTGDLLFRLHETERNYREYTAWFFREGSLVGWAAGGYWRALFVRLARDGPVAIFLDRELGMVTSAAGLAAIYATRGRLRPFLFPAVWFLSLALMFNFASTSLFAYQPLFLTGSYLYPVLMPAVALTAGLIDVLLGPEGTSSSEVGRERRFWGAVVAAAVVLACCGGIYHDLRAGPGSPVERELASRLSPADPIETDSRTASVLRFFWRYPATTNLHDFEHLREDEVPPGSLVLLNRMREDALRQDYGYDLPDFYARPPRSWVLEWSGSGAELYRNPAR
jgi:4-amino-4-deoxy-L-arabinose transferase-like glycosyltransferase